MTSNPMEELREQAAKIGYRVCAETRHVSLGDKVEAAIRALPLPAPVALPQAGVVEISREVFDFLCGSGPLEGSWFGDRREGEPGAYWWRKRLHVMDATPTETPTAAAPDDGLTKAQHMLRMVAAHASGGHLENCAGMSLNDICVAISQHHNRVWEGGIEKGKKLSADDGLMGRWMPIETAPKDGTDVLLTSVHSDGVGGQYTYGGYPCTGAWLPVRQSPKHSWCGTGRFLSEGYGSPTHWMPLPAAPAALSTATGDEGGKV